MTSGRATRRKRKVYGAALPKPAGVVKKLPSRGSICVDCMDPIDLDALKLAMHKGESYRHRCGRMLVWVADPNR